MTEQHKLIGIDTSGYKSADLMDQPQPLLIWADLSDLVIDTTYQRNITTAGRRAIQKIADGFDWRKYQPILVAPTDGGKMAIVDGQHRAHAAALCGISSLPAMTVAMNKSEQAAGFAAINRDRIAMNPLSIYRAELAAGADWAEAGRDTVAAAGCPVATAKPSQVNKVPRTVYSVNLIKKMVEVGEGEVVTAGLSAISNSDLGDDVASYNGQHLAIWFASISTNQKFLKLNLADIFEELDFESILDDCRIKGRQTGQSARSIAIRMVSDRLQNAPASSHVAEQPQGGLQ